MEPVSGELRAAGCVAGSGRDRTGLAPLWGRIPPPLLVLTSRPLSVCPQAGGILRPQRCSARWGQRGTERRSNGVGFQGHSTPTSG